VEVVAEAEPLGRQGLDSQPAGFERAVHLEGEPVELRLAVLPPPQADLDRPADALQLDRRAVGGGSSTPPPMLIRLLPSPGSEYPTFTSAVTVYPPTLYPWLLKSSSPANPVAVMPSASAHT